MPNYQTKCTVTSRDSEGKQIKLAPGVHPLSREVGEKLVARGFAKEVVEAVQVAEPKKVEAPAQAASESADPKGKRKSKAVKDAKKAESETPQGEAQAQAPEPGKDA